ncbi:ABC transporter permease [Streptomyces mangrovisoli]|uniref:Transport permease protein n=1 Tax=Streptomyces mangrovisoli TaxID=1428628 RepID=A0A1J4P423_9ACTN|nr:ABC transporter permease [Streptomyces mangrovisoli]OIJ68206.1 ABC transporter permease [Streptomyces mangrovisoli]
MTTTAAEHPATTDDIDVPRGPERWSGTSVASQIAVLSAKSLRRLVTDPKLLLFSVLQPLILLLLFGQIFNSISDTPDFPKGVSYIDFLVPAIMVNTALQSALMSGTGLNEEIKNGMVARFRTLPIWLGSVLFARSVFDLARGAIRLTLMVALAAALFGFSPDGGPLGVLGAFGLALAIGWGLGWVFLALAVWLRNGESMQAVGFLAMLPLMFASNAFVPVDGLPGWLGAVAKVNPMTYGVQAARDLALGNPAGYDALLAVGISFAIGALAIPLAVRGFRRPA